MMEAEVAKAKAMRAAKARLAAAAKAARAAAATAQMRRAVVVSLMLAMMLVGVVGCGGQSQGGASASGQSESASASTERVRGDESGEAVKEAYEQVLSPTSMVTAFIGEPFTDQKITDEKDALEAIKGVYDRIGADETTELEPTAIWPTENDTSYYVFNQVAGDVRVYGSGVKLIVDKEGTAVGLVSAILPGVKLSNAEDWEISSEDAESIVLKQCKEEGVKDAEVVEGATEQALIPIPYNPNVQEYAWVVYTPNYNSDSEMGYLAHYVEAAGTYLYSLPIAEPHNADAESGDKAYFEFDKYEQTTWTGTVDLHDGTTKEITVPILIDPEDGTQFLADGKRKILCADYAAYKYEDTYRPRVSNDASFSNVELLAYDTFIKVWDFYESIGWTGPDDHGTPTLLLMDYVDSNGNPVDNAFYMGRKNGFQVFTFNRLNPDGENMDIIAHEFTHCVTSTTMTTNLYLNDMGAINEGMSDVMGNLVEMMETGDPEAAWLMGEGSGAGVLRSMKDPHEHNQPEYRWDTYYAPTAAAGTELNDQGGVHTNSSLLNIVSYKLDQAGMAPNDQFFFWMNVALAMTPRTDYEQMAALLPWCMEQSGYTQYVDALKKAIDEAGYTELVSPETPPAGDGKLSISYDAKDVVDKGCVKFMAIPLSGDSVIDSWPAVGTTEAVFIIPAGEYYVRAYAGSNLIDESTTYAYTDNGWAVGDDSNDFSEYSVVKVEDGKVTELSGEGLPDSLEADDE